MAALLESIPYLLTRNRLPPLEVLNSIFESGGVDSGMSGGSQWKPFSIGAQEYSELTVHYQKRGLDIARPPSWVKNRIDFQIWELEADHGIPAQKHRELSDIENSARMRLEAAIESGASKDEVDRLHLKAYRAGNDLHGFVDSYLEKDNN